MVEENQEKEQTKNSEREAEVVTKISELEETQEQAAINHPSAEVKTPQIASQRQEARITTEEQRANNKRIAYQFAGMLIAAIVLGITFIWLVFPLIAGGSAQQIYHARQAVARLYVDDQHDFLKANVTEAEIQAVQSEVGQIGGLTKNGVDSELQHAVQKFQVQQALEQLYDGQVLSGDVVNAKVSLKEGLTAEQVSEKVASLGLETLPNDRFKQVVQQIVDKAVQDSAKVPVLESEIAQLDLNDTTEAGIVAAADQLMTLETTIADLAVDKTTRKALQQQLNDKVAPYAKTIRASFETTRFTDEVLSKLYATKSLARKLAHTPYDKRKLVALTFDDGPSAEVTPIVLDILRKHDIKAAFFLMGGYVEQSPELVRQMLAEGHEVGNHTYTHPDLATLSDAEVRQQLQFANETIQEAASYTPTIWRMPFGSGGERVYRLAKEMNLENILWDVDSADWMLHDGEQIVQRILDNLEDQMVILMHDTHITTAQAIEVLIPILKEKGYEFVFPEDIDLFYYYQEVPGYTDTYDHAEE